jgi:homoaconitate hydratase family protein
MMREFSNEQGVKLYDVGSGICHQLLPEEGWVKPGDIAVGADSHTCTYGALGAFATGIGSTEIAAVFLSGKLWFKVPETMKCEVEGKLPKGVTPKDVILKIISKVKADGATYKAVEFSGQTVKEMSVSGRMTLCNMAVEMGAKTGIVEPDEKVEEFLGERGIKKIEHFSDDKDCKYSEVLKFQVDELEPQIACPYRVDNVKPVSDVEGLKVDQAFIGSCTNGRLEDLEGAAQVLKGNKVRARTLVIPASKEIYLQALKEGLIEVFLDSGCVVCNPGCGPCPGGHMGLLGKGEVCISTSNRNFRGRMGSPESEVYLASPLTVAASAIEGKITDPRKMVKGV